MVGLVHPVYVGRVHGAVHDLFPIWVGDPVAEVGEREAAPHGEDQIRFVQEPLCRGSPDAEGEGVVLGEAALPLQCREHRCLYQLREPEELIACVGVEDALPGIDQGPLCGDNCLRSGLHVLRIALGPPPLRRCVGELVLVVLPQAPG